MPRRGGRAVAQVELTGVRQMKMTAESGNLCLVVEGLPPCL